MSADAADDERQDQTVTLTVEEALAIRGVFNVILLIWAREGLSLPAEAPAEPGLEPLYERLSSRLDNRVEQTRAVGGEEFQEVLSPTEAQAILDAAETFDQLLLSEQGRETLVSIGFFRNPRAAVDPENVDDLESGIAKIEPTNVRQLPAELKPPSATAEEIRRVGGGTGGGDVAFRVVREEIEAIRSRLEIELRDPSDPPEQLLFRLESTVENVGADLTCIQRFATLATLIEIAVQIGGHALDADDEIVDLWMEARDETLTFMRFESCGSDPFLDQFEDRLNEILGTAIQGDPDVITDATDALTNLIEELERSEGPDVEPREGSDVASESFAGPGNGAPPSEPDAGTTPEGAVDTINTVIGSLDDLVESPAPLDSIRDQADRVAEQAMGIREMAGEQNCFDWIQAWSFLSELAVETTSHADPTPGEMPDPDQDTIDEIQRARKAVMAEMGRLECIPTESMRDLRDLFISIHDPTGPEINNRLDQRANTFLRNLRAATEGIGDVSVGAPTPEEVRPTAIDNAIESISQTRETLRERYDNPRSNEDIQDAVDVELDTAMEDILFCSDLTLSGSVIVALAVEAASLGGPSEVPATFNRLNTAFRTQVRLLERGVEDRDCISEDEAEELNAMWDQLESAAEFGRSEVTSAADDILSDLLFFTERLQD